MKTPQEMARELSKERCGCPHCIRGWDENRVAQAIEAALAEGKRLGLEEALQEIEAHAGCVRHGHCTAHLADIIRALKKGKP